MSGRKQEQCCIQTGEDSHSNCRLLSYTSDICNQSAAKRGLYYMDKNVKAEVNVNMYTRAPFMGLCIAAEG